jgi:glycosyltransferase involved in cell wall biosynthesis
MRLLWLADANTAHTERWVNALADRGHEILLFSLTNPLPGRLPARTGVRLETAGLSSELAYSAEGGARKLWYASALPKIAALQRRFRPHVSHAHYASSYGVLGMLAQLRPRVLSIWGADVYNTPHRSVLHRWIISRSIRSADMVLSTSYIMREQGLRLCRREIDVLPFGIDTSAFAPAATGSRTSTVIGTVKSLEDKYGIDVLLHAFASLRRERASAALHLLIVGGGSLEHALKELAQSLGIAPAVTFAGRVPYARAPEMHNSLDIAVFPSVEDSESFGVSVIEAQACARPVVVSRVGGLPEVIIEGETGLIVPPRDARALASAIGLLLDDPARAAAMGLAGRRHVTANYDLGACVDTLEGHYAKLAGFGSKAA